MARLMAFVDGENLTARFEAMVKDGWQPRLHAPPTIGEPRAIVRDPGRFVWSPSSIFMVPAREDLLRVHYYTTYSGAPEELETFKQYITRQKASKFQDEAQWLAREHVPLVPRVFEKKGRATRTKSVDINLCVEMLEYIRQDALDAIYLITGDVDYLPLIEAAMRAGKKVYIAALASGLSPLLQHAADRFVSLDETYFDGRTTAADSPHMS